MRTFRAVVLAGMATAFFALAPQMAMADGDPVKGEKGYKRCKSCHSLEEGENRVGPSLFGIIGRQAGTAEGYDYSDSYVTAGEQGLVWDQESLIAYLEDPKAFMVELLGTDDITTKMRNKFRKQSLRENIAAYLAGLAAASE